VYKYVHSGKSTFPYKALVIYNAAPSIFDKGLGFLKKQIEPQKFIIVLQTGKCMRNISWICWILLVIALLVTPTTASTWWDNNWHQATLVTIAHPVKIDNYVVPVNYSYYNTSMRSDFGDVRFVSADNTTEYSYWIDSDYTVASTRGYFWVNVSTAGTSGVSQVFMYFDNPTATTTSDGNKTFLLWDTFASNDTSKWTGVDLVPGSTGTYGVTTLSGTSVMKFNMLDINWKDEFRSISPYIFSNISLTARLNSSSLGNAAIIIRGQNDTSNQFTGGYFMFFNDATQSRTYRKNSATTYTLIGGDSGSASKVPFHRFELRMNGSTIGAFVDGVDNIGGNDGIDTTYKSGWVGFSDWGAAGNSYYVDFVFARPFNNTGLNGENSEPTASFGITGVGPNAPPIVIWNRTPAMGNISTTVQFVDSSTGTNITQGGNFYWNLSDGNTSSLRNLSHVFPASGEYSVYSINHSVTDSPGLSTAVVNWSNQSNYITVYSNLTPFFNTTVSGTSGTAGTTRFDINNSQVGSINIDIWNVSFGEGVVNTTMNASHTYPNAGQYSINVSAFNYTLGIYWINLSNYITISNPSPVVSFNGTPLFANATTPIAFVDTTTGTNVSGWNWLFNDGNISTTRNISNTFPSTAEFIYYSINHSATDSYGTPWAIAAWDNQTNYIRIFKNATPTITATANVTSGTRPTSVEFTGTSYGAIKVDNWSWNFGDGNTSILQDPTNTYSQAGQYTATLTGTNYTLGVTTASEIITISNPPPVVTWNGTPTYGNISTAIDFVDTSTGDNLTKFYWDLNDGNTSTLRNLSHAFPSITEFTYYSINHSVTDSDGTPWQVVTWENESDYLRIFQNLTPTITFTQDKTSGEIPLAVAFTATEYGAIKVDDWAWDFGDGNISSLQNPTNIFPAGQFTVTLAATNYTLGTTTITETDLIIVTNPVPVVDFNATPLFGNISTPINFVDKSTGINLSTYYWELNDGNTSTSRNLSHVFPAIDEFDYYSINHSVMDSEGTPWITTGWKNESDYLRIFKNLTPTITFTQDKTIGDYPLIVLFVATEYGAIKVDDWAWDFGDGNTSSLQNPSNTYSWLDTFNVELIAMNYTLGVATSYSTVNTTGAAPVVDWNATPTSGDHPLTVVFVDKSTGGTSYYWNFGDGNTSTTRNISHTYDFTGLFAINHSTTNSYGTTWLNESDLITVTEPPIPPPVANFYGVPTSGYVPLSVDFFDTSTGVAILNWSWDFGDGNTSALQYPSHIYEFTGTFDVSLYVCNYEGCDIETKLAYIHVLEVPIILPANYTYIGFASTYEQVLIVKNISGGWDGVIYRSGDVATLDAADDYIFQLNPIPENYLLNPQSLADRIVENARANIMIYIVIAMFLTVLFMGLRRR
jgi:PKD repeat protein